MPPSVEKPVMIPKLRFLFVLLFAGCLLNACETEFEVVNDGPLKPVVYCLINPYDTIHYARVENSVKGSDGVLSVIRISDSLYFKELKVELSGSKNGVEIWKYPMLETPWYKDSGIFASENHILYVLNQKLNTNIDSIHLIVNHFDSELEISSRIVRIGQRKFSSPRSWENQIGFYRTEPYKIQFGGQQLTFTVHIKEITEDSIYTEEISWTTIKGFDTGSYHLTEERFFNKLRMQLNQDPSIVARVIDSIDFEGLAWSQGVQDYVDTWLLRSERDYPPYSNIENAWGIFASYCTVKRTGLYLDVRSSDSLCKGRLTEGLNFRSW